MTNVLARGLAALLSLAATGALAQTATPTITRQPGGGAVIQDPGRMPVYINPLPGRGNYWVNDLNQGPRRPVGPQPAPSVEDD